VMIPVKRFDDDEPAFYKLEVVDGERADELVTDWPNFELVSPALTDAEVVFREKTLMAHDLDAAAEAARELIARNATLWRLRGKEPDLSEEMLIRDVDARVAELRPTWESLEIRPAGIAEYLSAREAQPDDPSIRRIADALGQLAQARTTSHGSALADLWTVAETLFGGITTDKSMHVSERLADVAEYLYLRDVLRWLAPRLPADHLQAEGIVRNGTDSEAQFTLRVVRQLKKSLPDVLADRGLALEHVRFRLVARWGSRPDGKKEGADPFVVAELDAVSSRVAAVSNRAYLVRNLFLHQGNPQRAAAMSVTLPIFAAVLREVMGHINRTAKPGRHPLVESESCHLRARTVAEKWARDPSAGRAPLDRHVDLSDD
jgi:hypothetical protein